MSTAVVACSSGSDASDKSPAAPPPPLPPPTIAFVSPGVEIFGEPVALDVYGHNFRDPDIMSATQAAPTVTLLRIRDLDGKAMNGPEYTQSTTVLSLLPRGAAVATLKDPSSLPTGVYSLTLRTAAGLEARRDDALIVLPRPGVSSVTSFFCDAAVPPNPAPAKVIGIDGANLYRLPPFDLTAEVYISPNTTLIPRRNVVPDSVSGCQTVPFAGGDVCFLSFAFGLLCNHFNSVELCSHLEVHIPIDIDLTPRMAVSVVPPQLDSITIGRDPKLDLLRDIFIEQPISLPVSMLLSAVEGPVEVPLRGGAPVVVGPDAFPTARIDDAPFPVSAADCQPSGAPGIDLCRTLTATLPQGFAPGEHRVEVETAAGCAASTTIRSAPKPVIRDIAPAVTCQYGSQLVSLSGDGFIAPNVYVDGQFESPYGANCVPAPGSSSCLLFGFGSHSLGAHRIEVETPSTPRIRSDPATIQVVTGPPFPGQMIPGLVCSSGRRTVFAPVSNVTGRILSVRLFDGLTVIPVEFAEVAGGVEFVVPASAGTGFYRIEVFDESPCPGRDGLSRFLDTVEDPVVAWRDFEADNSALFVRTETSTGEAGPPVLWLQGQGQTGSAIGASRDAAGSDWDFVVPFGWGGGDDGLLRFDLRSTGAGEPRGPATIVMTNYSLQRLEHEITPPPADGSWAHYELSLQSADGWTYTDPQGRRPAVLADLGMAIVDLHVPGSWWTGPGSAALDNIAIELAQ